MADNVNCRRCLYYYITWEPKNPHGCRAMGFKSRMMPSYHVLKDSGLPCQIFKARPGVGKK